MSLRSRSCPGLCNGLLSRLEHVLSAVIYRLEVDPMDGGMYQVDAYLRVRRAVMVGGVSIQQVSRVFGEYKYWLMTDYNEIDPYNDEGGYVLNPGLSIPGPPGFRYSTWGHRHAGGLSGQSGTSNRWMNHRTGDAPCWHAH